MDIVIVGAGSVGLLAGSYLAEQGHSISYIVRRPDQAAALQKYGVRRILNGVSSHVIVKRAYTSLTEAPKSALWIFAVKSNSLSSLLKELSAIQSPDYVLFIQNGVAHFKKVGELVFSSIGFSSITHGARKENDWTVQHLGKGKMEVSHFIGNSSLLEDLIGQESVDFPIIHSANTEMMLYKKLFINCCINPLTALLNVKNGELLKRQSAYQLMKVVYNELAVAYPEVAAETPFQVIEDVCLRTGANESSMLSDRKNNVRMEIDTIVTAAIGDNRETMPVLVLMEALLKAIDERADVR